jgi:hypothetical protein
LTMRAFLPIMRFDYSLTTFQIKCPQQAAAKTVPWKQGASTEKLNWGKIAQTFLNSTAVVKDLNIFKYGLAGSFSRRIDMPVDNFLF